MGHLEKQRNNCAKDPPGQRGEDVMTEYVPGQQKSVLSLYQDHSKKKAGGGRSVTTNYLWPPQEGCARKRHAFQNRRKAERGKQVCQRARYWEEVRRLQKKKNLSWGGSRHEQGGPVVGSPETGR